MVSLEFLCAPSARLWSRAHRAPRLRVHFHHRVRAQPGLAGHRERHGADDRVDHAHGRARVCELALLALDRPGAPLHGRELRVRRPRAHRVRRALRRDAPPREDGVGR